MWNQQSENSPTNKTKRKLGFEQEIHLKKHFFFLQWEIWAAGSHFRHEDKHDIVLCTGKCYKRYYWCPKAALAPSWWLNTIKHCAQAARLLPGVKNLCLTPCCAVHMYCLLPPAACWSGVSSVQHHHVMKSSFHERGERAPALSRAMPTKSWVSSL